MTNKKANALMILGLFVLIGMIGGLTVAFFNYTRTGSPNTITTGHIEFSSSQELLELSNAFPISTSDAITDTSNTDEAIITISGNTDYTDGIEYLITAEDTHVTIGTGNNVKTVPINIAITPEKTGDLGTEATSYFEQRGGATSYYYVVEDYYKHNYNYIDGRENIVSDNQKILVGYIAPGQTGVNGTIGIKAFFDKDKIAITDTRQYGAIVASGYVNGTTYGWINGRTVLTTEEWNNLASTPLSFKVKVEANEGVWVPGTIASSNVVFDRTSEHSADIILTSGDLKFVTYVTITEDLETGDSVAIFGSGTLYRLNSSTNTYDNITSSGEYEKIVLKLELWWNPGNYQKIVYNYNGSTFVAANGLDVVFIEGKINGN